MYEYRKLTPHERAELVKERLRLGYPPHSPPHLGVDNTLYLLTATCYNHTDYMHCEERRKIVLDSLFELFITNGMEIHAWVVLPNHYHILVKVEEFKKLGNIFRLIHGRTARKWNQHDNVATRKIWYRYSDRAIRSERHYFTTINYIHFNPVKHGRVKSPYEWKESSVHWYLANEGREWLQGLWIEYPVRDFGRGWDI